jgi:hypothetical protein
VDECIIFCLVLLWKLPVNARGKGPCVIIIIIFAFCFWQRGNGRSWRAFDELTAAEHGVIARPLMLYDGRCQNCERCRENFMKIAI